MIFTTLIVFLWVVYLFKIPFLYNCLHLVTDLFTAGRSEVKVILLLLVVTALYFFKRFVNQSRSAPEETIKKYANIFFLTLSSLFVLSFGTFVWYYRSLSIGINTMAVALSSHDLSTTSFLHIYVLKSSFGIIFSPLPSSLQNNADLGVAYIGILPSFVPILGCVGCILLLLSLFVLAIKFLKKNSSNLALQLLFLVAVFALVKNVFDGGFFNYETIPAFIVCWILLYGTSFRTAIVPITLQLLPLFYLFISYRYGILNNESCADYLRTFGCQELVYLGWYALAVKASPRRFGIFILILGFIGGLYTVLSRTDYIPYSYQNLNQKTAYLGTYNSVPENVGYLQEKIGDISIYKIQPKTDIAVKDILGMSRDTATYFPISIEYQTCFPLSGYIENTLTIASQEDLVLPTTKYRFMYISAIKSVSHPSNKWKYYNVTFSGVSCAPRPLDLMQELLKEAGGVHMVMLLPFNVDQDGDTISDNN